MTASIRGHQGYFKALENGVEQVFNCITSVSVDQDSTFSRSMYVGQAIPEGDQTVEGWSGSAEMEVKDDKVEAFIDALITNNMNGIGVSEYSFIVTENYPDGTSSSYVYFDVQWKLGRKQSGLNEKITKTLTFQASGRLRI